MQKNFCELNLLDRSAVEQARSLLDPVQADWHSTAFSAYKSSERGFNDAYFEQAGLIINAAPTFAQQYCRCGMSNASGRTSGCNLRKFCPRCARIEANRLHRKFEYCYGGRNWYSVTLSFKGNVALKEIHRCKELWTAIYEAFTDALREWRAEGAVYSEEVKVVELLSARLNPHAHALMNATDLPRDAAQNLTKRINRVLRRRFRHLGLQADVLIKPIEEPEHYENTLKYLLKVWDLAEAYRTAIHTKVYDDSKLLVALNSDVTDVLRGLSTIATHRKQIRYLGNMQSQSKKYIGSEISRDRDKRRNPFPAIVLPLETRKEMAFPE